MAKIRADRLLKLAEHLETTKFVPHSKVHDKGGHGFDFASYYEEFGFGTLGCAMGEAPAAFPRSFKLSKNTSSYTRTDGTKHTYTLFEVKPRFKVPDESTPIQHFFGLDSPQSVHLFCPGSQQTARFGGRLLGARATPKAVAKNIRAFVAKMQKAA